MRGVRALLGATFVVGLGGAAWVVSDRVEQRNDFCNACHLPDGAVLHLGQRLDFDRVMPVDLSGVHGRGFVDARADGELRCIDCHSGAGAPERLRVKLIAARDGIRYLLGDFEEPEGMPFDLSAATCRRCHPGFRRSAAPGWTVDSFHGSPEHDGPHAPPCVRCHAVHERDGDPFAYFMSRARVDAQCRSCHGEGAAEPVPSLLVGPRATWPAG